MVEYTYVTNSAVTEVLLLGLGVQEITEAFVAFLYTIHIDHSKLKTISHEKASGYFGYFVDPYYCLFDTHVFISFLYYDFFITSQDINSRPSPSSSHK
jgi:hypothetical protein